MIHPEISVRLTNKGLGVFARRNFLRGEILWIADDLDVLIPLEEYLQLKSTLRKKLDRYSYLDSDNNAVIAWDEGKYVNHSCSPNSTGVLQFDNISVALKDIPAGEEIMEDYYSYYGHFETFKCHCGSEKCRGIIGHDNTYQPELRLDMDEVAEVMNERHQVLLEVESSYQRKFLEILESYKTVRQ